MPLLSKASIKPSCSLTKERIKFSPNTLSLILFIESETFSVLFLSAIRGFTLFFPEDIKVDIGAISTSSP